MTNSQKQQLQSVINTLTGNYVCPSEFKSADVQHTDEFTGSILVKLVFAELSGFIWIRSKGAITDINGINLKKKDRFCYLPSLHDTTE